MSPLTADRNTQRRTGDRLSLGIAANKKIFAGSLVARDAAGNATPGAAATTLIGVGRAAETVDNTGGAAGALQVPIDKGTFHFANSAGDPITVADIGNTCYIEDDETVSKTNAGGNTQSVAGTIYDVDANGVWVQFK
jgi:hypothetical protein